MISRLVKCAFLSAVGFFVLLPACSRSNQDAEVKGAVTLGGQLLVDGLVTFRPRAGTTGPEFSGTIANGAYHVKGKVAAGDYAVDVRAWRKTGRKVKSPFGSETDEVVNAIPKCYWGPNTTVSAHLVVGTNEVNFELSSQ